MAEYIDREALLSILKHSGLYYGDTYIRKDGVIRLIENRPTDDVVAVVRCRDCVYRGKPQCGFWFDDAENKIQESWDYPDGFCSYGERKDVDNNG